MIEATLVEEQLKRIGFNTTAWNRAEALELSEIILPNEEIFECVNGWYEGGFALIAATNVRILLVDKKPFKYLTVEDLRFDMINEIDYSHRLFDARIRVSTGPKTLTFRSYNQQRLRKLISHVQHRMAEMKNEMTDRSDKQQAHLKQIDERLHTYLAAQYKQNEDLSQQVSDQTEEIKAAVAPEVVAPVQPDEANRIRSRLIWDGVTYDKNSPVVNGVSATELYEEGRKEIFSRNAQSAASPHRSAFSMLPAMHRNRHFGRALLRGLLIHPNTEPTA